MQARAADLRERREGGRRPAVLVIMGALLLTVLLAALDQTIVSTALPTIVSDLGGLNHLSWVVTAYLLAVTASTPLWGKLGDQFGRKWVFLGCIAIFLAGSALAGISATMLQLICFRALQGIGGGGLMVLASAIIGDIVSPRERGRYQGLFGAAFGLSSVAGPLIGGLFVDHFTWRWVFYVNIPLGFLAFVAVLFVLPASASARERHRIDYLGTALVAAAAVCVTLLASWGGSTYAWTSPVTIGLGVAAVVLGVLWWRSAKRAAEPVLPLRLFSSPVIRVGMAISFCVGFAMMGSMAFLPLFLQVVHGYSPTASGLSLLPMVLGMLITSIGSGILVTKTGRYKVFPILGGAVLTVALALLSLLGPDTSLLEMGAYFLLLGLGLGLAMQVIVTATQNAAEYRDLGVATSSATFARSIGGAFGTSVFGAVFSGQLAGNLRERAAEITLPPGVTFESIEGNPQVVDQLAPSVQAGFLTAYADAIDIVFLAAVPVALLAFVLALMLKEIPLRTTVASPDLDEAVAPVWTCREPLDRVERAVYHVADEQGARKIYADLARAAGLDLSPGSCWVLTHLACTGPITPEELARLAHCPPGVTEEVHDELRLARLLREEGGPAWELNARGRDAARRLYDAQRTVLRAMLEEYAAQEYTELVALLEELTRDTLGDEHDAGLVRDPVPHRPL
ncbi:MFS transporter [Nocardiopsis rhodophaea]|uniref:MFS transporter n=1 Tax=Nocardiopsis rhodophaea TaxID=280238 RepID=A0ABN2SAY7_9ACTN